MTATYWEIGCRIVESEQQGQQPEYGEALIKQLAEDLEPRFGGALVWRNLANAGVLPARCRALKILQTPSAKSVPLPKHAGEMPTLGYLSDLGECLGDDASFQIIF